MCTSFATCPTATKAKHSHELNELKNNANRVVEGKDTISAKQLGQMSSADRMAILREQLQIATQKSAQRAKEEAQSRNAKKFQIEVDSASELQTELTDPTEITKQCGEKRDYTVMTKEELALELDQIKKEEATLKKRKKNIIFNLEMVEDE